MRKQEAVLFIPMFLLFRVMKGKSTELCMGEKVQNHPCSFSYCFSDATEELIQLPYSFGYCHLSRYSLYSVLSETAERRKH